MAKVAKHIEIQPSDGRGIEFLIDGEPFPYYTGPGSLKVETALGDKRTVLTTVTIEIPCESVTVKDPWPAPVSASASSDDGVGEGR